MKKREDKLSEAVARLKQEGHSQELPKEVVDETLRRIADCGLRIADSGTAVPFAIPNPHSATSSDWRPRRRSSSLLGYTVGRLTTPKPMDLDQLREALTPSVAAALEPALRAETGRRDAPRLSSSPWQARMSV